MQKKQVSPRGERARKLVVPVVLAAGLVAGASAVMSTGAAGCADGDGPRPDAGMGDGGVDTPII
jgi:hypothetical protein